MKQHWDSVVVGGVYTDYLVRGPHLPVPGETVMGHQHLSKDCHFSHPGWS